MRRTATFFLQASEIRIPWTMSEAHVDEYEHFNYDYDKHIFTAHGGKQRSKREAVAHTNHFDPSGHSRKILTKLMNTEHNKRQTQQTSKSKA